MTNGRKLNIGLVGGGVISVDLPEPIDFQKQVKELRAAGFLLSEGVYITVEAIQWMALSATPESQGFVHMGTRQ